MVVVASCSSSLCSSSSSSPNGFCLNDGTLVFLLLHVVMVCEKTHIDWQSVWSIQIVDSHNSYGLAICMIHMDQQSYDPYELPIRTVLKRIGKRLYENLILLKCKFFL